MEDLRASLDALCFLFQSVQKGLQGNSEFKITIFCIIPAATFVNSF